MSKVLGAAEEQLPLFWGSKIVLFRQIPIVSFRFILSITNCFLLFRRLPIVSFRFVEYHKPEILYSIYQRIYIFMIVFLRKH